MGILLSDCAGGIAARRNRNVASGIAGDNGNAMNCRITGITGHDSPSFGVPAPEKCSDRAPHAVVCLSRSKETRRQAFTI
jgi:hypothetical protein